ncbi:MAG: hypothetical protein SFZ23_04975 [Planctomycetota bacterium]|nr:hypothetical protein [Planctomycetota bacterium]
MMLSGTVPYLECMETCTVRLFARDGEPLRDERVRETVVATAHAIAERTGVEIVSLEASASAVTVSLAIDKLAGMGFLAELRRLTDQWHEKKFARPLWPAPEDGERA